MHKSNLCTYNLDNTEKLLLSVALSLSHTIYLCNSITPALHMLHCLSVSYLVWCLGVIFQF